MYVHSWLKKCYKLYININLKKNVWHLSDFIPTNYALISHVWIFYIIIYWIFHIIIYWILWIVYFFIYINKKMILIKRTILYKRLIIITEIHIMYRCAASIIKCVKYVIASGRSGDLPTVNSLNNFSSARGLSKEHNTLVYKTRVKIKRQAVSRIHPRHDKFPSS